ncbi:UNKNOWN [Stylonychia lemnae]|uniref:Uncharacterized protein n=1 Tax=Stylonychia lemnae TaxID=5949 RepID=A0A078AU53_STYLE|nr:UNKNOWN [Stylonychia lemnae]|eukprot:CDW85779.1 UNKNOWN [Stylonychia lemnae]
MNIFVNLTSIQKYISLENFDDSAKDALLINSPRSLEACRRQGIEPRELVFQSLKKFKKSLGIEANSLTPQIIQMRYEHFEQRRREKLQILTHERLTVLGDEKKGVWSPDKGSAFRNQLSNHSSGNSPVRLGGVSSAGKKNSVLPISKALSSGPMDSAMIEKERQALEKIKQKQQKEIEQMMEYERKMQEIRDKNEEKQIKEKQKEEQRQQELFYKQKEQEAKKAQEEERR